MRAAPAWGVGAGEADARRDAKLGRLGYRVLRVEAERVVADLDAVVAEITAVLAAGRRRGG